MGDRNLTSGKNEHTVVRVHSPAEGHEERAERCLARVTRRGITSLEIEFPYPGVHYGDHFCLALLLSIPSMCLFIEIPTRLIRTFLYGPLALWPLVFVPWYLLFIYSFVDCWKFDYHSQTSVKITRDSYCLIRKSLTWISFLQITWIPSHFDDHEKGNVAETITEDTQHPRYPFLRAEVVTEEIEGSARKHIKLGFITFAHELSDYEVERLAEKINRFLRATR